MELIKTEQNHSRPYEDSHLFVDFLSRTVRLDGVTLNLTPREFDLLAFLIGYPGESVPRPAFLRLVWEYSTEARTRTLDVHVRRLRKHLGRYGKVYIETIFGFGYRFEPQNASPVAAATAA